MYVYKFPVFEGRQGYKILFYSLRTENGKMTMFFIFVSLGKDT